MEYMKSIPDKFFDLAVVDPPYGINAPNMAMGSNLNRKHGGYNGESVAQRIKKGRLNQEAGKLKNRALNTMQCDWDFYPPSEDYFCELERVSKNRIIWGGNYFKLPPTRGILCWDKMQPWENFSQFELAWTSFDCPAAIIHSSRIAAYKMGFDFYATEIDKDYFLAQEKRFKDECLGEIDTPKGCLKQMNLFE